MNEPVQFKGTQTEELISSPEPMRRKQHKFDETGDSIMAKEDDEVRPEAKLAVAAGFLQQIGSALQRGFRSPAPVRAAATKPFMTTAGGVPTRVTPQGHGMINDGGRWRLPQTSVEASHVNNLGAQMSHFERHRMAVRQGLKADSGFGRFGAKAKDLIGHPAAAMAAPIIASSAMSLIPAGRDEYGNRRSLADTGVGSLAANIGVPLAMATAPSMMRRAPGVFANKIVPAGRPTGSW